VRIAPGVCQNLTEPHALDNFFTITLDAGALDRSSLMTWSISSVLAGSGLGYIAEEFVAPLIEQGYMLPVLRDWAYHVDGLMLYWDQAKPMRPTFLALTRYLKDVVPQRADEVADKTKPLGPRLTSGEGLPNTLFGVLSSCGSGGLIDFSSNVLPKK
jgi:hypothetical protein